MRARRLLVPVSLAPLVVGAALLAGQGWIGIKATLAEVLIERAYAAGLADGRPHPPWGWADMHPVALLEVPRLKIRRTVLSGCSGSSLAFGPGHLDGSARPNGPGNCALAGHRDSWFAFLEQLRPGDRLRLSTRAGPRWYHVTGLEVRSMRDAAVLDPSPGRRLTLITCYPFGALFRGDLRYVVTCQEVAGGSSEA